MAFYTNQLAEFIIREKTPTEGTNGWIALLLRRKGCRDWAIFKTTTRSRDHHETVYEHALALRDAFAITMPGHFDDVPEPKVE